MIVSATNIKHIFTIASIRQIKRVCCLMINGTTLSLYEPLNDYVIRWFSLRGIEIQFNSMIVDQTSSLISYNWSINTKNIHPTIQNYLANLTMRTLISEVSKAVKYSEPVRFSVYEWPFATDDVVNYLLDWLKTNNICHSVSNDNIGRLCIYIGTNSSVIRCLRIMPAMATYTVGICEIEKSPFYHKLYNYVDDVSVLVVNDEFISNLILHSINENYRPTSSNLSRLSGEWIGTIRNWTNDANNDTMACCKNTRTMLKYTGSVGINQSDIIAKYVNTLFSIMDFVDESVIF